MGGSRDGDLVRVTMVTPFPGPDAVARGGVEAVAVNLAGALVATGRAGVQVVASGDRDTVEHVGGIRVTRVRRSPLPGVVSYWSVMRRRLQRAVAATDPDVTHFQGFAGWALAYAPPHVLTVHGIVENDALHSGRPFPRSRSLLMRAVEDRGRRRVPEVIVINPYVEEVLGDRLGGRRWPIENPIDARYFGVRRDPGPVVLYSGRVIPRKNVTGLIEAVAVASRSVPGAVLRVAGSLEDPGYVDRCRGLAAGLGLDVRFLGELPVEQLMHELAGAACLALTSHQETAPLVVSEAMAAGVPVVAFDVGGVRHMVEHGVTGFVTAPGDIVGFAGRLADLVSDRVLGDRLGAAAREAAVDRFEPGTVASRTLEVYRAVLSGGDAHHGVEE